MRDNIKKAEEAFESFRDEYRGLYQDFERDFSREGKIDEKMGLLEAKQKVQDLKLSFQDDANYIAKMYTQMEQDVKNITDLQKQLKNADSGTPLWDELNRQLEEARKHYDALQESVSQYSDAKRNLSKEENMDSRLDNIDNANAIAEAEAKTKKDIEEANLLYEKQAQYIRTISELKYNVWQNELDNDDASIINEELEKTQQLLAEITKQINALPDYAKNDDMAKANSELAESLEQQLA